MLACSLITTYPTPGSGTRVLGLTDGFMAIPAIFKFVNTTEDDPDPVPFQFACACAFTLVAVMSPFSKFTFAMLVLEDAEEPVEVFFPEAVLVVAPVLPTGDGRELVVLTCELPPLHETSAGANESIEAVLVFKRPWAERR